MKILVAIASFGRANDHHLERVIEEYRSMSFGVDIVVLSNESKPVPSGVELVVGLPEKDPWSLPFGHKKILASRVSEYDLFIYSEDDILITEKNLQAFLGLSAVLPIREISGFLRFEVGPDGRRSFPDVHVNRRWSPGSVRRRGRYQVGFFTNEHSGCYVLTQAQLREAIGSGGYLVDPHREEYDLACTAATDPYKHSGFEKVVCISHLEDFLVRHLSDKYAGKSGLSEDDFNQYIEALVRTPKGVVPQLFKTDSVGLGGLFSKDYYEPARRDLISLIPNGARSVLSIGCGWGATEAALAETGRKVAVMALDPVMESWAESRGLRVVRDDLATANGKLREESIDCLFISNVLHLADEPSGLLSSFAPLLSGDATVIATVPNLPYLKAAWKRAYSGKHLRFLGDFGKSGVRLTSHRVLRKWFKAAGIKVERLHDCVPENYKTIDKLTLKMLRPLLASETTIVGRFNPNLRLRYEVSLHGRDKRENSLMGKGLMDR